MKGSPNPRLPRSLTESRLSAIDKAEARKLFSRDHWLAGLAASALLLPVGAEAETLRGALAKAYENNPTLTAARECGLDHALVVTPGEHTSDAQLLRLVEQAHAVSDRVAIVIHPEESPGSGALEPRWMELLAQATDPER